MALSTASLVRVVPGLLRLLSEALIEVNAVDYLSWSYRFEFVGGILASHVKVRLFKLVLVSDTRLHAFRVTCEFVGCGRF